MPQTKHDRLSTLHTGKGNHGYTNAVHGKLLKKSTDVNEFFNQIQMLRNSLFSDLEHYGIYNFENTQADQYFLDKVIARRWLGSLMGSAFFLWKKIAVPEAYREFMKDRIAEIVEELPNLQEFVLRTTLEGLAVESTELQARQCEIMFWRVAELHGEDIEDRVQADPESYPVLAANSEFFNILGDYLFAVSRYALVVNFGQTEELWDNHFNSGMEEEDYIKNLGLLHNLQREKTSSKVVQESERRVEYLEDSEL